MQIKYKHNTFTVNEGDNLLSFLFTLNENIDQSLYCTKGQCKRCYSIVMDRGAYSTREVLACQTAIYSPLRIVALPKSLS